jgi:hypothetical protein
MTIPAFPRTVPPNHATYPAMPTGLVSLGQSGIAQTRTTTQVGRTWEETYIALKANTDPVARGFLATLVSLFRNQTQFTVAHLGQLQLLGAGGGTPVVNGANQTGFTLVTNGWTASTVVLKAGDIFTIAGVPWVYDVTADVTSDGSGNATIPINPPLIGNAATSAPASGAAITINSTPGTVTYTAFIESLDMPQAGAGPGFYQSCRVKFREVPGTPPVVVSPGLVVLTSGVSLTATLPALAGGGSGLPVLAFRMHFLDDALLGPTITASGLVLINSTSGGTSLEASVSASDGVLTFQGTANNGEANQIFGTMAQSALPAAGTIVTLYVIVNAAAGTATITLETDDGTVLFTATVTGEETTNLPAANTTVVIGAGSSGPGGGLTIDGAEITTAAIAAPNVPPTTEDDDAIAIWGFAGTLAPTGGVGVTLTPVGGAVSYLPGGTWF